METITTLLGELINVIKENNSFINTFLIPILVGIIPSIILLIQNHIIEERNRKLQLNIQIREERNQLYNNILNIYNTYTEIIFKTSKVMQEDNFYDVDLKKQLRFIDDVIDVCEYENKVIKAFNQSRMIFCGTNDTLIDKLERLQIIYSDLVHKLAMYISDENFLNIANTAWDKVELLNENIPRGDVKTMKLNKEAKAVVESICITDKVREIQNINKKLVKEMDYENFDKLFEEYLQIKANN